MTILIRYDHALARNRVSLGRSWNLEKIVKVLQTPLASDGFRRHRTGLRALRELLANGCGRRL